MCNLAHMEEEMWLYWRDLEAFKGFLKYMQMDTFVASLTALIQHE